MTCYERFHWTPTDIHTLGLQEAEQLAIYFEEVLQHERKEMDRARQSGDSSTNTQTGTIGNNEEEYAFEDPDLNPDYTDPYDDAVL